MSDPKEPPAGGEISPAERARYKRRLDELGGRLDKARGQATPGRSGADAQERGNALGSAMRIALELVVGVGVGAAIGWYLDQWLGTKPWLLLFWVILGFVAGLWNVVRSAQRLQSENERRGAFNAPSVPFDDDNDGDDNGGNRAR